MIPFTAEGYVSASPHTMFAWWCARPHSRLATTVTVCKQNIKRRTHAPFPGASGSRYVPWDWISMIPFTAEGRMSASPHTNVNWVVPAAKFCERHATTVCKDNFKRRNQPLFAGACFRQQRCSLGWDLKDPLHH